MSPTTRKLAPLTLCFIALIALAGMGYSQTPVAVDGSGYNGPVLRVDRSDMTDIDLTLTVGTLDVSAVETKGGSFSLLSLDYHGFSNEIGKPRLPVVREFIEIPRGASYELVLSDAVFVELPLTELGAANPIAPAQAPVLKIEGAREEAPFVIDGTAYATDGYILENVVRLGEEVVMRGRRLVVLEVYPVDYNPAAGTVKVLTAGSIHIDLHGADAAATKEILNRLSSARFNKLARSVILNAAAFETPLTAGAPTKGRATNYLMIAAPAYVGNAKLLDLVSLRNSQGYNVTLVDTGTTGTSRTAIKNYIQNAYNTQNIEYFLLVGDTNTIPCWTGNGSGSPDTDLDYACVDGSDYFPDLARGRFPVRSSSQLNNICNKIIANNDNYEKKAVFMASEDNYYISEGTHNYVINNYLGPQGWTSDKLYSHTYNATTQQVRNSFNDGRTLGIFSGHGYSGGWADGPAFDQGDVRGLTNDIYPFVQSYACSTLPFSNTECFGETWVVDDHGATAFIGASLSSYWDEDDILEKRIFKGYIQEGFDSIGDMIDYGQYQLYLWMGTGSFTQMYYEMYNLMGEPAMKIHGGGGGVTEDPETDVKINGSDNPASVHTSGWVTVTISLDPGDHDGEPADWWVYAEKDSNTWWRKFSGGWKKQSAPTRFAAATLRMVNDYIVLGPRSLPAGIYDFYFDVDDQNNNHEGTYSDMCTILVYN